MQKVAEVARHFINLIYPLHCAICKKTLGGLDEFGVCGFCISEIRPNPKPYCGSCGRSLQNTLKLCRECQKKRFHFDRAYSACLYEGALKDLVHLFKYSGRLSLASLLSKLMIDYIKENGEIINGIDLVTYVPLSGGGVFRKREFNQSGLLASKLSDEFDIAIADILKKAKRTRPQNELSRDERLVNLKGVFTVRGRRALGNEILLIDDVMTTGATLDECSKVLLASGARKVRCLTLARGL